MAGPDPTPLCVDLDGTLIAGDTLVISLGQIARQQPWRLPVIATSALAGRAALKTAVAAALVPNPAALPWRDDVVEFVRREHSEGRHILLATAAHRRIADSVAAHLGCFAAVVATEGTDNAKGEAKVEAIRRAIGTGPFDYVGDSSADLPIFAAARHGYLVAPSSDLRKRVAAICTIVRVFEG
ncbi:MAG: haloacid dehalogenase-like hydrolase [Gemmatimonadaceae bacterium]